LVGLLFSKYGGYAGVSVATVSTFGVVVLRLLGVHDEAVAALFVVVVDELELPHAASATTHPSAPIRNASLARIGGKRTAITSQ
jgi:hypothetical protein